MFSLLDAIQAAFSRELVGHVAARLHESEGGVGKALSGIVPIVLGGLINKAASCEPAVVYTLSERAYQLASVPVGTMTGMLAVLGGGSAPGSALWQGENLLGSLFGYSERGMVLPVSTYAGIRPESAAVLLRMTAAVLPSMLGQYAVAHQLTATGLAAALLGLKGRVRALLPQGLSGLMGLLWLGGLGATAPRPAAATVLQVIGQRPSRAAAGGGFPAWGRAVAIFLVCMLLALAALMGRPVAQDSSAWQPAGLFTPRATSDVSLLPF